ncbi:hypothetical protein D9758_015164 [Tetrapyrgos nigripes]|uniref:Uncharacterized protein n=1 Tax=Tetrapyrgos nigripes TaxID=182062 RepID=A0A8H5FQQ3_9AGAR|nr:hypothetical protein D9758_015164 [Tetrapyrgos nigripes]
MILQMRRPTHNVPHMHTPYAPLRPRPTLPTQFLCLHSGQWMSSLVSHVARSSSDKAFSLALENWKADQGIVAGDRHFFRSYFSIWTFRDTGQKFRQQRGNDQVSSPSPSDNEHGIDVQIFTSRLQAPTQGNLYALLCISGFTIPHNRRRRHRQNPDVLTVMLVTLVTPVTHTKSERPNDLNIVATPTHCALLTKLTVAIDGYYLYPGWSQMASKLLVLEIFRWFGFWMTKPTMAASALGPSAFALRLSVKHPTLYILLLSLISKTPSWRFVSLATI